MENWVKLQSAGYFANQIDKPFPLPIYLHGAELFAQLHYPRFMESDTHYRTHNSQPLVPIPPMRATCLARPILLHLIILIISYETAYVV
jgi:hypothetical protein